MTVAEFLRHRLELARLRAQRAASRWLIAAWSADRADAGTDHRVAVPDDAGAAVAVWPAERAVVLELGDESVLLDPGRAYALAAELARVADITEEI